jgi:hypothetical protein
MSYPPNQGWPQQGQPYPGQPYQQPAYQQQYQQPYGARPQQFGPPQPAGQWPQQAPVQQLAPQAQPYDQGFGPQPYAQQMVDPNAVQCRFCGCVPAARVTFRGHRGMVIMMTFLSLAGPFCRDCGLSTFRRMTASTLIAGWWGYASFLITPVTVIINLVRRGKVANLPAPVPPPNGGPSRQPMDPGAPLLARPQALIGLALPGVVFVLFLVVIIVGATTGGS